MSLCFSPQGQKFRSKSELEAYLKRNNMELNISDFNFTVRDQGLLDITSNVTHGGIECLKRKRLSEEISVGDVDPLQHCLTDSVYTKTTKKYRNSQKPDGDDKSRLNLDVKPSGRSRCTSMKKLVVRMKFSALQKIGDKHGSPNGVRQKLDGVTKKSNSETNKELKTNGKKLASLQDHDLSVRQRKTSAKKSVRCKDDKRRVSDAETKPARGLSNGAKLKSSSRELTLHCADVKNVNIRDNSSSRRDFCGSGTDSDQWVPPQSPFNLVEESLYYSSWRLLIASLLLENREGEVLC
jgi:hypothetical protein